MTLLVLGDSQVERVWNHVRGDREQLRTGQFYPVKNRASVLNGFKSIKPNVSIVCWTLKSFNRGIWYKLLSILIVLKYFVARDGSCDSSRSIARKLFLSKDPNFSCVI